MCLAAFTMHQSCFSAWTIYEPRRITLDVLFIFLTEDEGATNPRSSVITEVQVREGYPLTSQCHQIHIQNEACNRRSTREMLEV